MFAQRKSLDNSEKSLSQFIPFSAVIAPGVVICREGDLVATVKISGKVFEAVSNEALQRDAERQNNFLKVMASASSTDEMSLKVHRIRRVVHDELSVPDELPADRAMAESPSAFHAAKRSTGERSGFRRSRYPRISNCIGKVLCAVDRA